MSQQSSAAQERVKRLPEQKPRTNVYTMMLILAFIAICVACTVLWLELSEYAPDWWKTEGVAPVTFQRVLVPGELPPANHAGQALAA